MNAILVFDPSNDLLFAKSNKLFRQQVLKYSKLQGLIAGSTTTTTTTSSSSLSNSHSQTSSSSSSSTSSRSESPCCDRVATASSSSLLRPQRHKRQPTDPGLKPPPPWTAMAPPPPAARALRRHRPARGGRRKPNGPPLATDRHDDTDKSYLDVLMLLLTPYVASLRLSSSMPAPERAGRRPSPAKDETRAGSRQQEEEQQQQRDEEENEEELLDKFLSSINVNHDCNLDDSATESGPNNSSGQSRTQDSAESSFSHYQEFSPRRFASIPLPVKCLENCQIVYCELYDFIFIYMQELEQVSSFKMRLLQKRVDLFARLALILFGPSLNSMRQQAPSSGHCHHSTTTPTQTSQTQMLRQVYDVWLENHFEASFLLEANERLLVSKQIEQLCQDTLHKVSIHLRRPANGSAAFRETQMHALLYSDTKLVSSFSCRSGQPINKDDLILLLLLLKTHNLHHDNQLEPASSSWPADDQQQPAQYDSGQDTHSSSAALPVPDYCYASNYNANRRTYEMNPSPNSTTPTSSLAATCSINRSGSQRRGRRLFGESSAQARAQQQQQQRQLKIVNRIPTQFLVFLSTSGKFSQRLRVPHMVRFVTLARGMTLMLISEISTSYLGLQLNKVLRILLQFDRSESVASIKLNQLAQINDCVCAIKTYFYGPNYEFRKILEGQARRSPSTTAAAAASGSLVRGKGSDDDGDDDDQKSTSSSTWSMGHLFGKYLRNKERQPSRRPTVAQQTSPSPTVYDHLEGLERRQCCQLMCRLEDLVSNNVHTYMRRTFNLPIDERKREALIGSAATSIRESMHTFVVSPQMAKLQEPDSAYMRLFDELLYEVKLMVREELSDYLEYLAVKSGCNVTLGAPLTHDMPAIRSFIYVDRSRQELLVSPTKPSSTRMDKHSLLEADFCGALARDKFHHKSRDGSGRCNDEGDDGNSDLSDTASSDLDSYDESRADEAGSDDDQDADSDSNSSLASSSFMLQQRVVRPGQYRKSGTAQAALQQPRQMLRTASSRWRLGASGDIMVEGRSASSASGRSLTTTNNSSSWASDLQMLVPPHLSNSQRLDLIQGSDRSHRQELHGQRPPAQQQHLVDENLMKGFTCFVYNRLANGRTSYTSTDGTYVYSYFLWFKRNTGGVIKVNARRKSEAARRLAENYSSLPSVVCDDFFTSYANCLFGGKQQPAHNTTAHESTGQPPARSTSSGRNQVKITLQVSQVDGRNRGRRLVRHHLTQVNEIDEDEEEELVDDYRCSLVENQPQPPGKEAKRESKSSGRQSQEDFHMFLRSQMSGRTGRTKVQVYQGSRRAEDAKRARATSPARPECFELFCVHQASLLVHRSQILVEAERLARRLARLTE